MKTSAKIVIAASLATTLLVGAGGYQAYKLYIQESQENTELKKQLEQLTREEERSTVMQHVNAQMEEIANEERRISDEQREAAEEQTRIAEEMRRKAETERQNALVAEKRAIDASEVAQHQRTIAEQQRAEAELSKRVTDTLSYITLARTIGNTAITQFNADNHELADLLAYTACVFTERYHGDIYSPTIYQALAKTSQNKNVWNKHKGRLTDIAFADAKEGYFITCSTYGEIMKHRKNGNKLVSEMVFSNSRFDFRDLYIVRETEVIYALSRTGQLVVVDGNKVSIIDINIPNLMYMDLAGSQFIIFAEQGIALFDTTSYSVIKQRILPFKTEFNARYKNYPVIFDKQGRMHIVKNFDKIEASPVPMKGQVTAFAESKGVHLCAYGMSDGTIYIVNEQGKMTRLVGHRSKISKLKANGYRLYSSSYDGTLNLWLTNTPKIEPMTMFTTRGWIINFTLDLKKEAIWTGDQNGNLTMALISVPLMQQLLRNKLKRNLTHEEWNYYIGQNVPYEQIYRKEERP